MPSVKDIVSFCHKWAPPHTAAAWDNVGLEIGRPRSNVSRVLLSLDVDQAALSQIEKNDYDLVITHHPIFYKAIKHINPDSDLGRIIYTCLQKNTALFTMHTNLDAAVDGVNDTLIRHYDIDPTYGNAIRDGLGKIIELKNPIDFDTITQKKTARIVGPAPQKPIQKIAFCSGSGGSFLNDIYNENVEVYITGEMNYHGDVFCELNNICTLLLGHKESEVVILPVIKEKLSKAYPDLSIDISGL